MVKRPCPPRLRSRPIPTRIPSCSEHTRLRSSRWRLPWFFASAPARSRTFRLQTASSGTSRTRRPGRRTAAASPPAAARIPFNGFGYLKLQVRRAGPRRRRTATSTSPASAWRTTAASASTRSRRCSQDGIVVSRAIYRAEGRQLPALLRHVHQHDDRRPDRARSRGAARPARSRTAARWRWRRRRAAIGASTRADSFVTVMQNARGVADPMRGPSGHGPSAHVLGSKTAGLLTGVGDMYADPFADRWPGFDPAHIGYVFTLTACSRARRRRS